MIKNLLIMGILISTVGCSSAPGGDGRSNEASAPDPAFKYIGSLFLGPRGTSFGVYYSTEYNVTCVYHRGVSGYAGWASIDCEKGELFEGMKNG